MTLANVTSAIQELERIDPLDELAYEKAILAYLKIQELPIFIFEIPAGQYICRARTHETPDLFKTIKDISFPPNQVVSNFARCNRPFQSKFYGAETRPTSFMELVENWVESKNFGDHLYVTTGLWVTKKSLSAIIVTTPDIENRTSEFDKIHGHALDNVFLEKYDGESREALVVFYRLLFERFRKPSKNDHLTYIITAAYCNLVLAKAQGQANCIFYPSVPFAGQGVNFVINDEFIRDENIELQSIMCNEMTVSENEDHKHSFTESNAWTAKQISSEKNKIEW